MTKWKIFEMACTDFLNKKYGDSATFVNGGGANSTVTDIQVKINSVNKFSIEVKKSPAQCGQFVLFPNEEKKQFEYSYRNSSECRECANTIIEHMNRNYHQYIEAGTSGQPIIFAGCEDVFVRWITEYYKAKNVKFFMTNNNIIAPIENFSDYFMVSAKYRVKRSGSSGVRKSLQKEVSNHINCNFNTIAIISEDQKLFVESTYKLNKTRFVCNSKRYMFSARGDKFEVRKLSNTGNANVIFSIVLKSIQNPKDLICFENSLKS